MSYLCVNNNHNNNNNNHSILSKKNMVHTRLSRNITPNKSV